jgi:hypothetical protein
MPGYSRFASRDFKPNPQRAAKILDELWSDIENGSSDPGKLKRDVETCKTLIPDDDVSYFVGYEYVEDSMCSLMYAVESELKEGAEEAVWAAERAQESLFGFVESLVGNAESRADMVRIDAHPLMQAELRRQEADLADLQTAAKSPGREAEIIARIRRRAQTDAEFFFRLP